MCGFLTAKTEGFTQDCRGDEWNDGIEMKEKAKHCESTGEEGKRGRRGGVEGKIVIMKTSA